jgi:hypothetical protein
VDMKQAKARVFLNFGVCSDNGTTNYMLSYLFCKQGRSKFKPLNFSVDTALERHGLSF